MKTLHDTPGHLRHAADEESVLSLREYTWRCVPAIDDGARDHYKRMTPPVGLGDNATSQRMVVLLLRCCRRTE